MTWFLVAYLSYSCPGGLLSGFVPLAARPLVCKPEIKQESYELLDKAQKRIEALGPLTSSTLIVVKELKLKPLSINWTESVSFEEK